jgi:metaxin
MSSTANGHGKSFFSVPIPVKRLFDSFPLLVYPANDLPLRSQQARKTNRHALFCWSTPEDAKRGAASFNPMCLRWQVSFYALQSFWMMLKLAYRLS